MGRYRLFIAGDGSRARALSARVRAAVAAAEGSIDGVRIEVIDVLESPSIADRAGVIATPTLQRDHPGPRFRLVGDLGDDEALLARLRELLASPR